MAGELREFISMILTEIIHGVKDAQSVAKKQGGSIVPPVVHVAPEVMKLSPSGGTPIVNYVEFDVALTATKGDDTKLGLHLSVINIGSGGRDEQSTVSHVKFKVPIALPVSSSKHFWKTKSKEVSEKIV